MREHTMIFVLLNYVKHDKKCVLYCSVQRLFENILLSYVAPFVLKMRAETHVCVDMK